MTVVGLAPVWAVPLDPTTIPKYVTPLVIPPVMPTSTASPAPAADYDIAVRQFQQQVLPAPLPPTTVWSYGRAQDTIPPGFVAPVPVANGVSFNYPAFTVEATSGGPTTVRWINDLVVDPAACAASPTPLTDPACNYLPHLLPVDQTLHWANPSGTGCMMPTPSGTNCETMDPTPYTGPVPIVTHLHGSHVQPHSDGYPEAWWLPAANNLQSPGPPAVSYVPYSPGFTQANNTNAVPGSAYYSYQNDQPATTIWYHDHALGMTRVNVYAGPAGFWLIRGGANGDAFVNDGTTPAANDGILPGPAPSGVGDPNFNAAYRATIREIPVAIQDRSFNTDGTLFYPADRSFFDGFVGPYIGDMMNPSDLSGIWNPEFFANTMVVNGTTWPQLDVAQERYRLRLLNGCNSRTLNLSMFIVTSLGLDGIAGTADDVLDQTALGEVPFYQIGGDQGFLPQVVKITTGQTSTLPGNGRTLAPKPAPHTTQALLLSLAERADVIVDFGSYPVGTRIRMINTAPDAPFGGFPDVPANSLTTGQVMDFVVAAAARAGGDPSTPPVNLVLPAEAALGAASKRRPLSLNELGSDQVCVQVGTVTTLFSRPANDPTFQADCAAAGGEPMGPREAVLGLLTTDGLGTRTAVPIHWHDPITEFPLLNSTEIWEFFNTTMDAHPIHLHLVRFEVVNRQNIDMMTLAPLAGTVTAPLPNERGYKDTVLTFPGQVTRIKATFDIAGLYVWHCHIIEHEDNEMMRPFMVIAGGQGTLATGATLAADLLTPSPQPTGTAITFNAAATGGDATGPYEYQFFWRRVGAATWTRGPAYIANGTSWVWDTAALGLTPGSYNILVQTRHVGNPAPFEAKTVITFKLVSPTPATGATLDPGLTPSPQPAGTAITFTAAATGGDVTGPYEYRFFWRSATTPTPAWTPAGAYGVDTWLWDTAALALPPGPYSILVYTRHVGSPVTFEGKAILNFTLN